MSSEFLTQDEVDTLLAGVDGTSSTAAPATQASEVQPFHLEAQDPATRTRLDAIEVVNERFRRLLRAALFDFMGRVPEVTAGPVRVIKYLDFTAALLLPASLHVVRMNPLHGNALFAFDPTLTYLIVDNLFGGDGRFQPRIAGRECSSTEQQIIKRLLKVIFGEYEKSWKSVYPLSFELVRSEWSLPLANVARPDDSVIAMSFTIEMGSASGAFHICVPYTTLEPIRELLSGNGETKEPPAPDEHWLRTMSRQVQVTEVELVADLVTLPVTVEQLLSMTVGDVLTVEIPETVTAQVDGVPIFDCRFGTLNGQYALRIASSLIPDREPVAGESHAQ